MKNKKHIGSTFESFLYKEGILEEVNETAVKAILTRRRNRRRSSVSPINRG